MDAANNDNGTGKSVKLVFSDGSPDVVLPVLSGTMGPDVIDIT